jgi:hypothetical protein
MPNNVPNFIVHVLDQETLSAKACFDHVVGVENNKVIQTEQLIWVTVFRIVHFFFGQWTMRGPC